jgi:acyl-CoA synthetase (AMP-forming)/AMP-acid ligase II
MTLRAMLRSRGKLGHNGMTADIIQVSTFESLLQEAERRYGNRPFLIDDQKLGSVSYADVFRFANGVSLYFDRLDIPVGARVAMLMHNCGIAALFFLSVIAARRVLVPVNPLSTPAELDFMLKQATCDCVIVDPSHTLCDAYTARSIIKITDHRSSFDKILQFGDSKGTSRHQMSNGSEFCGEIVFTSGSTGQPKGVVLAEQNLLANATALAQVYELGPTDRFLTVCPLFHNSGQVFTTLCCMISGGATAAVNSATGMQRFWSYISKYNATWSFGMVSFLALLLSRPEVPSNVSSMRGILTGGSAIDGALIQRFESRFGIPVRTVYGLTETSSISTCEYLDPSPRSLGSSGRPLPNCEIRLSVQTDGKLVDKRVTNTPGEILISGSNVFQNYIGEPQQTSARKVDGWLKTGDIGYFDENGNLFVIDRLDSMLIVGGENVYPAEIEKLCSILPGAAQIVLVGIDHPIWGKELVLVYKATGDQVASEHVWRRILQDHVVAIKIPQRFISIAELGLADFPRKENGKLDRKAIATSVSNAVRAPEFRT